MSEEDKQVVRNCVIQLEENNRLIGNLFSKNVRNLNKLRGVLERNLFELSEEKKERYKRELASDGWKKTAYYLKNF